MPGLLLAPFLISAILLPSTPDAGRTGDHSKSSTLIQCSGKTVRSRGEEPATGRWNGMPATTARSAKLCSCRLSYNECTPRVGAHRLIWASSASAEKVDHGMRSMCDQLSLLPSLKKVADEDSDHYCSPLAKLNTTFWSGH